MKKKEMKMGKDTKNRVYIFFGVIVLIYLLLILKMYHLQVVKYDYYKKLAEDNSIKRKKIESPRGKIYDRNGKLIVTNIAGYKLVFTEKKGYQNYKKDRLKEIADLLDEEYNNIYVKSFGRKSRKYFTKKDENKRIIAYELKKLNDKTDYKIIKDIKKYSFLEIVSREEKHLKFFKKQYNAVYYIPSAMKEAYERDYTKNISKILEIDEKSVKGIINRGKKLSIYSPDDLVILDDFEEKKAHILMEKLSEYPFLDIVDYPKRKYLYNDIACHIIGYVKAISQTEYDSLKHLGYEKTDNIGKDGLEKYYDHELKGEDGFNYVEVDVKNIGLKEIESKKAIPGKDLYLTLDLDLQVHMTKFMNGKKGAFIAMDSKTGEIITAVSSPTYNLNTLASKMSVNDWEKIQNNVNMPLTNRISVGSYAPGSVFKPVVCFGILDSNISPDEKYYSTGTYRIGNWEWKDWKKGGHGLVDMYTAIEESCNTYFYNMGNRIGKDKIIETSFQFGLGRPVELDVYEVGAGRIPTEKWKQEREKQSWYQGDTINMAIGQGYVLTTPMQILQLYNMIANNGIRYSAHYLKKIKEHDGTMKETIIKTEYKYDTNKKHFNIVKEGLRRVVYGAHGTAKVLRRDDHVVVAKTGSAQNSHYEDTHAWAAGFVPIDNPEITFTCFMEGAGGGGGVAAPVVKEFLNEYYKKYGNKIE